MKALAASFNVKHDKSGNIIFEPKDQPQPKLTETPKSVKGQNPTYNHKIGSANLKFKLTAHKNHASSNLNQNSSSPERFDTLIRSETQ